MTLKVAHEVGFAAAMVCGLLGLLLGDFLPQSCWVVLLVVPISAWQSVRNRPLSTRWGAVVGLAFFAAAAYLMATVTDGAALQAASLFLVGILCARLLTRGYPSHDLQALVLSLLLMFAGALVHQAFTYALTLIVYTVTATWALLTRQLISGCTEAYFRTGNEAEMKASLARTDVVTVRFGITVAALAWCILLATGLLFVLFPRVGLGGMHLNVGQGILADSISLSGAPRAQGTAQVVVRLRGVPSNAADDGLYLRGRIYDVLNINGFARSKNLHTLRPSHMRQLTVGEPMHYELEMENADGEHVLSLGPVLSVALPAGRDLFGTTAARDVAMQAPTSELVALQALTGQQRLKIYGYNVPLRAAAFQSGNSADLLEISEANFTDHFLRLPEHLDPKVVQLAQNIVGTTQGFADRALKLRQYLLHNYSYTLEQPNGQSADPLAGFLFVDRRGHCEYFATAFAVMLRAVGVPSRVIGGYQGGTWDAADATVLFSNQNAHAWVEWYLPHRGWVVDDATPPSDVAPLSPMGQWLEGMRNLWEGAIMQFGLADQMALLKGMTERVSGTLMPLSQVHRVLTGHPASLKQIMWVVVALSLSAAAVAALLLRISRRRRGPRLGRALLATFERLARAPVPTHAGYEETLEQLRERGLIPSPEADALLQEATQVFCRFRFGARAPAPKTGRICRRLARLPPLR